GVGDDGDEQQAEGIDVRFATSCRELPRELARMRKQQPKRPPERAVDLHKLLPDGMDKKMPQRERPRLNGMLAALRTIRPAQCRPARRAPLVPRALEEVCLHDAGFYDTELG